MLNSTARARRIAEPSTAHESGNGWPDRPPPVTNSWMTILWRLGPFLDMKVIPVLDIRGGVVVLARGGQRAHYEPIRDDLHGPIALARRLLDLTGGDELYLADLDAIEGHPPNRPTWRALAESGIRAWVDAGIRAAGDADIVEADTIVAGMETLGGPEVLRALLDWHGPGRIVFSIDLRAGAPIASDPGRWGTTDPAELAGRAIGMGCRRLLLLDLARIGRGEGTGAVPWLRNVREMAGEAIELSVGGGVSGVEELGSLEEAGASAVLVASALHDGRLDRDSLARFAVAR